MERCNEENFLLENFTNCKEGTDQPNKPIFGWVGPGKTFPAKECLKKNK